MAEEKSYCEYCGAEATLVCKGCDISTYCSPECQGSAWDSTHREECAKMATMTDEEIANDPAVFVGAIGKFGRKKKKRKGACALQCTKGDKQCLRSCDRRLRRCEAGCPKGKGGKECRRRCRQAGGSGSSDGVRR